MITALWMVLMFAAGWATCEWLLLPQDPAGSVDDHADDALALVGQDGAQ